jgi:hypothetical protein
MMAYEHTFAIIGVATSMAVFLLVTVSAIAALIVLALRYCPRANFGHLPNRAEVSFFTRQPTPYRKGELPPEPHEVCFRRLTISRWFGLSARRKPSWFLGMIIWQEAPRP